MSRTALLVEDDLVIRDGLKTILTSLFQFSQVYEARNGVEALRLLKWPIDVLITDVSMPEKDGLELIQDIRRRDVELPIIVISGHADFSYAREALRQGATDYLLKPVDRMELGRALAHCFQGVEPPQEKPRSSNSAVQHAAEFIIRNIESELSLATVASAVSLSPQYLSSLFKNETGSTFVEFVTRARIDRAQKLLHETDLRVYEIAHLCGYRNPKTFMTTFKSVVGTSARAFRTDRG